MDEEELIEHDTGGMSHEWEDSMELPVMTLDEIDVDDDGEAE